jgi:pyruvate dehydrogenase E2 component (dihydrolipoamide acetyltransferase)/2-oxoisovalerate dehydrogenase E2 component (dihydrolipoyl transacylase)
MDFKLPELGEGVYEAEAVRWLVQAGDAVKSGQTLLEVLTDKATMEVPAPFSGVVQTLLAEPGQKLKIGDVILNYEDKKGATVKPAAKPEAEPKAKAPTHSAARSNGVAPAVGAAVKAAPSVRLMARKLGVDLTHIHGTGPSGRILVEDLSHKIQAAPAVPTTDFGKPGTRLKFAGVRRKIAEQMVLSNHTIPHYTYVDECDVTDLVKLREALKEPFAARGAKITYLAFFVKAAAQALKDVPIVNATFDEEHGEIVLHDQYHLGIAVATPSGLIVPVLRDADKKSMVEIAQEIDRLSNDARLGKSRLEDLRGATFTITSFGNIGGLIATPIVPPGQLGILGVGRVVKRPVYDEHGQIRPADMVYLSLSFDHRVLDGAVGAAFGNAVIRRLHNPAALLV